MFKKSRDGREIAIEKIKKNDSYILSTEGTIAIVGQEDEIIANIAYLIVCLLEELPQGMQKDTLAFLISEFKNEEEISDEDEELAQKVLDKIKELK